MKKMKKSSIVISLLVLVFVGLIGILAKNISNTGKDLLVFDNMEQSNKAYAVGLMYYDIWRYSDGVSWTKEGKPGDTVTEDYSYGFQFDKKVKSVKVYEFNATTDMDLWKKVRSSMDYYRSVEKAVGQNVKVIKAATTGIGTKKINIDVETRVTLNATKPKNITKVEQNENVQGLEYYMPIIIEVTFDSEYVHVMHYDMQGKKIHEDIKEEPVLGMNQITRTEIGGYEYKGYKFKMNEQPAILPTDGLKTDENCYFNYTNGSVYINLYYDVSEEEEEEPKEPGATSEGECMDPNATGVIKADDRDAEKFDVSLGIPSSEYLYVNVFTRDYLYKYKYSQIKGVKTYPVTVSKEYILKWTTSSTNTSVDSEGNSYTYTSYTNHESSSTVTKTYQVEREYSYWMIDALQVYGLDSAKVNNYALPNESVKIMAKGYTPPTVTTETGGEHIKDPEKLTTSITLPSSTVSGGSSCPSVPSEDFSGTAESAVGQVMVANDLLTFNDATLMNNEWKEKQTDDPKAIPQPTEVGRDVLYTKNQLIDPQKLNGVKESDGTVSYKLIASVGAGNTFADFPIEDINTVTIHTPVVCYANVHDDKEFNQRVTPDTSRVSIILDRASNINIPTTGQHRDILGYGNKDYKKYTRRKEVKFPFDIYIGTSRDTGTYVAANTWTEVPLEYENMRFYTPIWVDEGDYTVEFRCISINAPYDTSYEHNANLSYENYVAYERIPVQVIGRLYNFRVTDIEDYPNWEKVFRVSEDSTKHTDNYYLVGSKNQNGENLNKATDEYQLSVIEHPITKEVSIPTGYKFKFEMVSIGNMFNTYDCINITPRFYYVSKDGTTRKAIDLYYSENIEKVTKNFVKVGSTTDKLNVKYMRLGDADRNVLASEIKATAYCLGMSEEALRNKGTKIGYFNQIVLPSSLRMFIGNTSNLPSGVDPVKVKKSQQHWYGEYYIPNKVYAVDKGYDVFKYASEHNLTGRESFWLKDGYIIVNFKIDTVKDQLFSTPYLSYYGVPLGNMWNIEGAKTEKVTKNGITYNINRGDILFYDLDKMASDDYEVGGIY